MCTCVFQVPKAEGELKDEAEMKEEVEKWFEQQISTQIKVNLAKREEGDIKGEIKHAQINEKMEQSTNEKWIWDGGGEE